MPQKHLQLGYTVDIMWLHSREPKANLFPTSASDYGWEQYMYMHVNENALTVVHLREGEWTPRPKNWFSFVILTNNCIYNCIKKLNSNFQNCIWLRFQITNFCGPVSSCFIHWTQVDEEEEAQSFTFCFCGDKRWPSHSRYLLLSLNKAYCHVILPQNAHKHIYMYM